MNNFYIIKFPIKGDGVFDKMTNEEIQNVAWQGWASKREQNIHMMLRNGTENIIKESLLKKSLDNVTGILIGFSHLETYLDGGQTPKIETNFNRLDHLEELKHDYPKLNREMPLQTQTPLRNHVGSLNMPNLLSEHSEIKRTTSRGNILIPKSPREPFSLSKYMMDSQIRRSSNDLPKLNYYRSAKGF